MKTCQSLLVAFVALVLVAVAGPAYAGIIIIDHKSPRPAAASLKYASTMESSSSASVDFPLLSVPRFDFGPPADTVTNPGTENLIAMQIRAGLITEEEAAAGCGATAAAGPAGMLPLAAAGFGLLRLRRRR